MFEEYNIGMWASDLNSLDMTVNFRKEYDETKRWIIKLLIPVSIKDIFY